MFDKNLKYHNGPMKYSQSGWIKINEPDQCGQSSVNYGCAMTFSIILIGLIAAIAYYVL